MDQKKLLAQIASADSITLTQIVQAVLTRYRTLFPEEDVIFLSFPENDRDAREFHEKMKNSKDNPLMVLTGDCHYHTVAAPSEKLLDLIAQEMDNKGYLL